jgi:predicted DNA-binding transcriptional regulator AlpA
MPDTPTFVSISDLARVLNYEFKTDPPIAETTPYSWWKRQKSNNMNPPMPKPVRVSGNSVLFRRNDIIKWYGHWKGIKPLYLASTEDEIRDKADEILSELVTAKRRRKRG